MLSQRFPILSILKIFSSFLFSLNHFHCVFQIGDCYSGSSNLLFGSVTQSCLTLCDPMDCSRPGLPVHYQSRSLLKLMSIESVIPSKHLILCHPLLSRLQSFPASGSFPMSQLFTSGSQQWSFSFSISPSTEQSGLISFRIDQLDLLAIQGTLKSPLQKSPKNLRLH